jgi:uncharacterized YccA/Bax inhibitor family protein
MSLGNNPIFSKAQKQYSDEYAGPGFASVNNAAAAGAQSTPPPGALPMVPPGSMNPNQYQQVAAAGAAGAASVSPQKLQQMYNAPAVAGPGDHAMTIHDVIMKSFISFGVLLVGAVMSWIFASNTATAAEVVSPAVGAIMLVSMLVGFGLGMVNAFKKSVSPPLILAYAFVQGVFLGAISFFYQVFGEQNGFGNLVATAVLATFAVFAMMLFLYTKRIIKVTDRFRKVIMLAMFAYLAFAVVSIILSLFSSGLSNGIFGTGPIGILVSAGVVVLASFVLCLNFDDIEKCIQYGVPERESWRMAFGLMVTLIWLYLEILRLLSLFARE